jgi:hypothetical protein
MLAKSEMLEKDIEKKVCENAKKRGWMTPKWVSPNNRGVLDRIFIKNGRCIFVEFKRGEKGKISPLQAKVIKQLEAQEMEVLIIRSVEEGENAFT